MSNLENQLRAALRRREPSFDFAQRVLERAQSTFRAGTRPAPTSPRPIVLPPAKPWFASVGLRWAAAIAAAILLAVAGVVHEFQVRQERAQAERARQQAQIALRIASAKLNVALREIQRLNEGSRQKGIVKKSAPSAEEL
ncbi:MAG: hypothetical protein ACRD3T_00935 [Terriglobia bacterium]